MQAYQGIILQQEFQLADYHMQVTLLKNRIAQLTFQDYTDSQYSEDYEDDSSAYEDEEKTDEKPAPEDMGISEQAERLDHIEIRHTDDGRIECNLIWKNGCATAEQVILRKRLRRHLEEESLKASHVEDTSSVEGTPEFCATISSDAVDLE